MYESMPDNDWTDLNTDHRLTPYGYCSPFNRRVEQSKKGLVPYLGFAVRSAVTKTVGRCKTSDIYC